MTTAPEAIARFAREGLFVADPALTGRRLREKAPDLWPASGKGGGRNSPHCHPHHFAAFLLAQAAHLPSDAAAAVATLLPLQVTGEEVLAQSLAEKAAPVMTEIAPFGLSGFTLGHALETHIAQAGDPVIRARMPGLMGAGWTLTLCIDPAFAVASFRTGNRVEATVFGDRTFTGRSRRLIELPYKAIMICGELWQDTIKQNAARGRAALPVSHAHAKDPFLDRMDSTPCVRATSTPQSPRGDYHGPQHGPPGPAGAAAP